MTTETKPTSSKIPARYKEIKAKIKAYPHLKEKIYLHLLLTLHEKHYVSIDDIYAQARQEASTFRYDQDPGSPNVGPEHWSSNERRLIRRLTLQSACDHLADDEIDDLIFSVVKRDYIYALENIANLTDVSFGVLADKVREFSNIPHLKPLPKEEVMGLRVSLLRHFISDQLEFIHIAKHYLTVRDMAPLVDHTLGSAAGHGRIGGKAAGMLLGYKILRAKLGEQYQDILKIPESYYVRTDVFEDFLSINGLTKLQNQKYKSPDEIRDEFPAIQEVFRNGQFPDYIVKQCRAMLKKVGKHPLVVRSSSLLEDNFKAAFSGKYQSVFLGNQGNLDQRLSHLMTAIGEVFASGLAPDPLLYRRERDLLDYDEKVGILLQKVVGFKYRHYFLPSFAGVALSRNDYTWSPRLKPEDGLVRLVTGLGTRAVDRVGDDYPRLAGLTVPTLRPEVTVAAQRKYSQLQVDVINLQTNSYEIVPISDLLGNESLPGYENIFSLDEGDYLQAAYTNVLHSRYHEGVVTFDKLLKDSVFPTMLKEILKTIEEAYQCPVDIEFSHDDKHFYLLQTRPTAQRADVGLVEVPSDIALADQLFRSREYVHSGKVDDIEYVIFCDPRAYRHMPDDHARHQLARIVGKLNNKLAGKRFILMGPGRWGSNNLALGIPVQYSEINNTKALLEVAHREGNYTPEVSFGTHFFLDLVEADIHYLPLFPDATGAYLNQELLDAAPNVLESVLPGTTDFAPYVKVIEVRLLRVNQSLHLRMNGEEKLAMAYFGNAT
ncbi:MAG: PEP/pyruvate-binding domain-containing protein [Candidatus Neomarinimicrobiota bacterium]